jgi:SOS-response transcriptional repressor LexA
MFRRMAGGSPAPRRRDEALAIIIERIARDGVPPTIDQIGAAMRPAVCRARARELVDQLIAQGIIERRPGQRGLRVRDVAASRALLDQAAVRLGWVVAEPMGVLQHPRHQGQLPMLPPLEHLPDL